MSSNVDSQGETRLSAIGDAVKKKAKSSFRHARTKVIRMPSASKDNDKPKARRSVVRTGSFSDGCKTDQIPLKKTDMELLGDKLKKFLGALQYVQDVIDKGFTEDQLPGSTTIVIENIIDISQLLHSTINQQSSLLDTAWGKVNESLCGLVRWSDQILLLRLDRKAVDLQASSAVISTVREAVLELVTLAKTKMGSKTPNAVHIPSATLPRPVVSRETQMSLPEVPLTKRELQILQDTYKLSDRSQSAEFLDQTDEVTPPPKPPLPSDISTRLLLSSMTDNEVRPPLPVKQRSSVPCEVFTPASCNFLSVDPWSGGGRWSPPSSFGSAGISNASSIDDLLNADNSRTLSALCLPDRQTSRMSDYDNVEDLVDGSSPNRTPVIAPHDIAPPLPVKTKRTSELEMDCVAPVTGGCLFSAGTQVFASSQKSSYCFVEQQTTTSSSSQSQSFNSQTFQGRTVHMSISEGNFMSSQHQFGLAVDECDAAGPVGAPPLPPKLKHTVAYMSVFGHCELTSFEPVIPHEELLRMRHRHPLSSIEPTFGGSFGMLADQLSALNISHSSRDSQSSMQTSRSIGAFSAFSSNSSGSFDSSRPKSDIVPLLPPKSSVCEVSSSQSTTPKDRDSSISLTSGCSDESSLLRSKSESASTTGIGSFSSSACIAPSASIAPSSVTSSSDKPKDSDSAFVEESNILDDINVSDQLVFNKPGEDGPAVRGGTVDALVVHATTAARDFLYQEAFLATYRTFLAPSELIKKLLYRYNRFSKISDIQKKKLANNTFSLLVRVVDELCTETDEHILQILMELVCQLICDGELQLARIMRNKVLEKCEHHRRKRKWNQRSKLLSDYHLTVKCHKLTDFKSESLAEQMTLLDAELFQKIEIPEVLLWAKEQSEESSPNLTKFTEHFNKMSYWCRTRILEHNDDPRERERHFKKFIKIMQHLRRLNNFNSYLAILSAVDSAPVRRLEWQKQNVEALKEFCTVIDSSSSFRVYRQALAKAEPPCIPYIGLVLQDLTFVHIGNPDKLPDGRINFTKCWQMFTILTNMQRFGKCNYGFKKNEKILAFCGDFDDFISEESLWQLSEQIKPRVSKRVD